MLELQKRRIGKLGALAIKVVEEILVGTIQAPASVRLDAGKYVLKLAGHERDSEKDKQTKSLRDMSMDELMALAAAFRDKGAGPIAPVVELDSSQVTDITSESTT